MHHANRTLFGYHAIIKVTEKDEILYFELMQFIEIVNQIDSKNKDGLF